MTWPDALVASVGIVCATVLVIAFFRGLIR